MWNHKLKAAIVKFLCKKCKYEALDRGSLLKHLKSQHEGLKFPCEQCDYIATQKGNLLKHKKSIHDGIKHAYDQCDYKAKQIDCDKCAM